jgi:hypothetical protein
VRRLSQFSVLGLLPDQQANGDAVHTGGRPERALAVEREQFLGGLLNSYYPKAG